MENSERILIVDDDRTLSNTLRLTLANDGYDVVTTPKASEAIEEVKRKYFNLVFLDLMLPDMDGIELLRLLSKKCPGTCFIMFTGKASIPSVIEALKIGAYDYLIKPFDIDYLKSVVRRGIERHNLENKNKELFERLEEEKYKLEVILEANTAISNILTLEELADFVTAKAIQIAEAEKSSLMVVDEGAGELVLKGSKGADKAKINARIKIGKFISGWVAKEGQILLVKDIEEDPRFKVYARDNKHRYKTKSFISLPLKTNSKVIGVMNVTDKLAETKIFSEEDLRYLSLLAHQTVAQIENIRLCEKLSLLAITDALTNLYNHRYCHEKLGLEIMRVQRYQHPLSLIMFDIDYFKTFNDRYGHLEGDRVLRQVAEIMQQNMRKVDILCRYGGEEFTVMLPDTTLEGAKTVAEKIRKAVQEAYLFSKESDRVLKVTLSGGVAEYQKNLDKDDFISRVDQALYKAKTEGRNRICTFS